MRLDKSCLRGRSWKKRGHTAGPLVLLAGVPCVWVEGYNCSMSIRLLLWPGAVHLFWFDWVISVCSWRSMLCCSHVL